MLALAIKSAPLSAVCQDPLAQDLPYFVTELVTVKRKFEVEYPGISVRVEWPVRDHQERDLPDTIEQRRLGEGHDRLAVG
jgi:hypothetical protein